MNESSSSDISPQEQLLNRIVDVGINGFGVLPSAESVAEDHRTKAKDAEAAIDSVIAWSTAYGQELDL